MEGKDWAIVFATLAGPIFAVQAQKWIEMLREYRQRKMWVFSNLMATRASRLSPDHVRALNMIEMAFYGRRLFGVRRQTKTERSVYDAWRRYLEDLGGNPARVDMARRNDLFVALLSAVAVDVGFNFDRMQITQSVYLPVAHGEAENEQNQLRKAALDVATGRSPLKMRIESFPFMQTAVDAQVELQQKLAAALDDGALIVEVRKNTTKL